MPRVVVKQNRIREVARSVRKQADAVAHAAALAVEAHAKTIVPVQTGNLKNSIQTWREGPGLYAVGTHVEYAPYVEFGTRHMAARPYLRPAADIVAGRLQELAQEAFRGWQ